MKVIVEGNPKEIAAFVLELQKRQNMNKQDIAVSIDESIKDALNHLSK